jgi:hypothetical protein
MEGVTPYYEESHGLRRRRMTTPCPHCGSTDLDFDCGFCRWTARIVAALIGEDAGAPSATQDESGKAGS